MAANRMRKKAVLCPVCGGAEHFPVLSRRGVPTLLNRSYYSISAALSAPTGELDIVACPTCGLTFNKSFDASLTGYSTSYENDQSNSPAFSAHMASMADRILSSFSRRNDIAVVEIGCGQGQFLFELVNRGTSRISSAVGFDPAWRGGRGKAGVRIESRVFDRSEMTFQKAAPDVVILRHVIEHIAKPTNFFEDIRNALPDDWGGRLFVETPSLEWILRHRVIHDFFYEHCNYFTAPTLRSALARSGFEAVMIESVFEGQYHWVEATAAGPTPTPDCNANDLPPLLRELNGDEIRSADTWHSRIAKLSQTGKVAVWGAGAKGVSFVNAIDRSAQWITCIIDINPAKQDKFIPVTAHPIISPSSARRSKIENIIVMNPNYCAEIEAVLRELGWQATLFEA